MRGIVRIAQVKRREQKFWWWSRSKVNNCTGNNRVGKWKDYEVEVYASQIMIAKRIISNGNSGSGSGKHSVVWNLNECRMEKSNTDNLQLLQITCNAGGNRTYTILMDFHGSIRQWLPHFGLS
jgi:hypothetical protein